MGKVVKRGGRERLETEELPKTHVCVDWEEGVGCDCERIRALEAERDALKARVACLDPKHGKSFVCPSCRFIPGDVAAFILDDAEITSEAAADPAAHDTTSPYDGPRGPCPLGEYHHGGGYQLIRHDIRIRALEADLFAVHLEKQRAEAERDALKARLAEADGCLKGLGVTWSGSAYIGFAPEPSYDALKARVAELEASR